MPGRTARGCISVWGADTDILAFRTVSRRTGRYGRWRIGRAAGTGSGLHAHRTPHALALPESEKEARREKPPHPWLARASRASRVPLEILGNAAQAEAATTRAVKAAYDRIEASTVAWTLQQTEESIEVFLPLNAQLYAYRGYRNPFSIES